MIANRTPRPPRTQTNNQTNKRKRTQTPKCLRTIAYHGASSGRIAYACAPRGAQLSAKAALDLHRLERGGGGRRRARCRRGARARRRRARGRAAGDAAAGEPQLSRGLRHAEPTGATRGTRENRQRSASWSPDPLGSGPEEMPLAPEAPFANAQNLGAGSSSSPPGGWPSQKPRPHAPAHAHAHASPLVRVSMCRVGGLARSASQTNDANKRLQTAGVCKQWTG